MEVSLIKKQDKRKKQIGAPRTKCTPSKPSCYLSATGFADLAQHNQSVNYITQLYLEYRTLMLSDVFINYCYVQARGLNDKIESYEAEYPKIKDIYRYWGNLYNDDAFAPLTSFDNWAARNKIKVDGITCKQVTLDSDAGLVYLDITQLEASGVNNEKLKQEIADAVNKNLLLRHQQGAGEKVLNKTECMLDILFLKKFYKFNAPQCVEAGLASEKRCWHWFKDKYKNYQKSSSESKGLSGAIGLLTEKADLLISQALNDNFPRTSSSKF